MTLQEKANKLLEDISKRLVSIDERLERFEKGPDEDKLNITHDVDLLGNKIEIVLPKKMKKTVPGPEADDISDGSLSCESCKEIINPGDHVYLSSEGYICHKCANPHTHDLDVKCSKCEKPFADNEDIFVSETEIMTCVCNIDPEKVKKAVEEGRKGLKEHVGKNKNTTDKKELRTYTCAKCNKEFEEAWSDEEAKKECSDTFGKEPDKDFSLVCDDCYKEMGFK